MRTRGTRRLSIGAHAIQLLTYLRERGLSSTHARHIVAALARSR